MEFGGNKEAYVALLKAALQTQEPMTEVNLFKAIEIMGDTQGEETYQILRALTKAQISGLEGLNRRRLFHAFWQRWGKVNPAEALVRAQNDDVQIPGQDLRFKHIYTGWGLEDPAPLLKRLATDESLPERRIGLEGLMDRWGEHDHATAMAWARANLATPLKERAVASLQWSAVRADGATEAMRTLQQLPKNLQQASYHALQLALTEVPTVTLEEKMEAVSYGKSLGTNPRELLQVMSREFRDQARFEEGVNFLYPLRSQEDISKNRPSEDVNRILQGWSAKDPAAANAWKEKMGLP